MSDFNFDKNQTVVESKPVVDQTRFKKARALYTITIILLCMAFVIALASIWLMWLAIASTLLATAAFVIAFVLRNRFGVKTTIVQILSGIVAAISTLIVICLLVMLTM